VDNHVFNESPKNEIFQ